MKPALAIVGGILVLAVAAYVAFFSGDTQKKPAWDENERTISKTGSVAPVPVTPKPSDDAASDTPPPADDNTPASRDARGDEPAVPSAPTGGSESSTGSAALTATGAKVTEYWNKGLLYGFSIPHGNYFVGAGARDGASHSVAIKTGSGEFDFAGADVRVWFYPSKVLPELAQSESGMYQDPATGRTYLKLGAGTLMIEGGFESATVNSIIATARRE